ncbi:hypothetical protein N2601_31725 (plasmid) [Rhizobium sp. CB3060]|nr:hypothetical protein [Rhizobium tropici]UWU25542.1 hypothetical protein N2601_31725 [Rhizobium tropici]
MPDLFQIRILRNSHAWPAGGSTNPDFAKIVAVPVDIVGQTNVKKEKTQ